MSYWRVLEFSDSAGSHHIPQLLVKPKFEEKSYSIFLTDLSNIWSEELDLDGVVRRASQNESPIEVGVQDTTQLSILLDHVRNSLTPGKDNICHIVRGDADSIILHTSTPLPRPLGSLRWKFNLGKRSPETLRNELILPLLISSHIQHERVNGLLTNIHEKDKAIARLLDQFETSNLDLASAFPSIAGAKLGRRIIKREQAARHIPALQMFQEDGWREETAKLKGGHLSTLGLFEEALSECFSETPEHLRLENAKDWWTSIRNNLNVSDLSSQPKQRKAKSPAKPIAEPSDEETETEDEFETQEDFKLRQAMKERSKVKEPVQTAEQEPHTGEEDTVTDDDDLDALPKSQRHTSPPSIGPSMGKNLREAKASSPPKVVPHSANKPKGFRIGGTKSKETAELPMPQFPREANGKDEDMPDVPVKRIGADTDVSSPKSRRTFKIGGNKKASSRERDQMTASPSPQPGKSKKNSSPMNEVQMKDLDGDVPSAVPIHPKASTVDDEEYNETAEEKAERKRRELKRKNEELAKKQAQKKKKRF